ncbi:MAG TPA: SAM-dependent methyltransferase, partial [Alphaproteobacteria bacterium]|nr:SAM-dependent methyltransferase [Alphaproteobacteria bacterium]
MVDQETMAAYATHVERYRKLVKSQGGNRRLAGFIARFHPGEAVLDLGCGVGDSAARMRDAGLEVSCM